MNKIYAAFIFFTRIPLWKIVSPHRSAYSDVVVYWPLVGWLTGGVVALMMWGLSYVMAWPVAVVIAIVARLLMTGALHEDGLADFCDGFGCGGDKIRILGIMKDSHIGTYGVIGLIVYFMLVVAILSSLPPVISVLAFFAADPFCKLCAAQITNLLPYARPEGAKNGISYNRMSVGKWLFCFVVGVIPLCVSSIIAGYKLVFACILPIVVLPWLIMLMRKKIGGYTGDCCGSCYIICEVTFLIGVSIIFTMP